MPSTQKHDHESCKLGLRSDFLLLLKVEDFHFSLETEGHDKTAHVFLVQITIVSVDHV